MRLLALFSLLPLIAGCAEKGVLLQYRFSPGYEAHYRWSVGSVTFTESPTEQTTDRLQAVLEMQERVHRQPGGRIILTVRLRPVTVRENGEPGALPPPSTAEYEIDRQGRIRQLVKAGLSAGAVSSLEVDALASQIRPPLSASAVAPGGAWDAPLRIRSERTSIDFQGVGRLLDFDLQDRRRLARIQTERRGNIISNQQMNNSRVVLKGRSSSKGLALLDIDGGILFSSNDRSTSEFDVFLSGRPAAKLTVTLTSRLQLDPRRT